ncbi:MAG: hypothetical protein LKM31_18030 [Sphingobium sp.]|jgi:phosphoribosylformylglycinamidine synthase|nr:hypothetical protein [Sphingobium sp.]
MAEAIFHKWELDFAVIGEVTDTGRMVLVHNGDVVCDIPLARWPTTRRSMTARMCRRPRPGPSVAPLASPCPKAPTSARTSLKLMGCPDIASPPLDLGAV